MVLGEVERDGDMDLRRPAVAMETTVAFLVDFGLDLGERTAISGGIKWGGTSTTIRSLSASDTRDVFWIKNNRKFIENVKWSHMVK